MSVPPVWVVAIAIAVPLLQRLAPIYLGPKANFPPLSVQQIPGYVTRIAPSRFSGIGPWAAKTAE